MTEEDNNPKSFLQKILSIQCMKKSLTYGITGGLAVGLSHFLFTSNVSKATNFALGGYLIVLFGTWGVCRYNAAVNRFKVHQWQKVHEKITGNIELIDPKDV
ncbi:Cytochrome c oxidase assembly protein cox20, mitochondrial [Bulinus truncatus]|nr:Cytochrome c oxidase assembly protein cox20, mitochondrial [Bulinus truncatus]